MITIQKFTQGNPLTVQRLNELVSALNRINNFTGDACIKIKRCDGGYSVGLDMDQVNARIIKGGGGLSGGGVRMAILTANAGSGYTITADLIKSDGTQDTTGDGHNITVNCSIMGGSDLSDASPLLESGKPIFVVQYPFWDTDHTVMNWGCVTTFQAYQDCALEAGTGTGTGTGT